MTSLIAPIIQVCDAISGARPGARREVVESYIKRLKEMEDIALSYPGVVKTYAIQAGRELRVIVGADKLTDQESEGLSHDIAKKIQDEMTYPGQVKITVIRETRAVSYANKNPARRTGCTRPACRKFITGKNPSAKRRDFLSTALLPVSSGTQRQLIRDRIHTQSPDSRHGKGHKPLTRRRGGAASGIISSCYAS